MNRPYASLALSKNVNPKWVAEQLGITLSTLERHYGRLRERRREPRKTPRSRKRRWLNGGNMATCLRNEKRPRRDLNPCYRRERPVSWAGLDDGDGAISRNLRDRPCMSRLGLEPRTLGLKGRCSTY